MLIDNGAILDKWKRESLREDMMGFKIYEVGFFVILEQPRGKGNGSIYAAIRVIETGNSLLKLESGRKTCSSHGDIRVIEVRVMETLLY